jgi:hypothetical protein
MRRGLDHADCVALPLFSGKGFSQKKQRDAARGSRLPQMGQE